MCARGKGSVPRARVYANYASRCANERITVLNPASFGKLVRVLFPGLKTRRLGVRGESKYHYVNFTLLEDQAELPEPEIQPLALPDGPSFSQSFKYVLVARCLGPRVANASIQLFLGALSRGCGRQAECTSSPEAGEYRTSASTEASHVVP